MKLKTDLKTETIQEQDQDKIFANRCSQTKCNYYIKGGCKNCSSCQAKPYMINHNCESCVSCMTIPDNLRFEMSEAEQKEAINDLKEMINEMRGKTQ